MTNPEAETVEAGYRRAGGTQVGLSLPQHTDVEPSSAREIVELVRLAEESGFDSVWGVDGLFTAAVFDPLLVLTLAALRSERVRLGVGTLVLPFQQPLLLARAVATLDQLSSGRVTLGVAAGMPSGPHEAFGNQRSEREARVEEYIALLRRLFTGEPVDYEGSYRKLRGVMVRPRPVQDPLPIWLGGSGPRALERAARLGDGWIGTGTATREHFASQVQTLRDTLDEIGRGDDDFTTAKRVYVAIGQRPESIVRWFNLTYGADLTRFERAGGGAEDPLGYVVSGSIDDVTEELIAIRAAGAGLLVLHPVGDDFHGQLRFLATHSLPALRTGA